MAALRSDARHWHQPAAEAGARAARIMDDGRRARQISKADECDRLAEQAQRLLVEDHSLNGVMSDQAHRVHLHPP